MKMRQWLAFKPASTSFQSLLPISPAINSSVARSTGKRPFHVGFRQPVLTNRWAPPDPSSLLSSDNVDENVEASLFENEQDDFREESAQSELEEDDSEFLEPDKQAAIATAAVPEGSEPLAHPSVYGSNRKANEDSEHNDAFRELSSFSNLCHKNAC